MQHFLTAGAWMGVLATGVVIDAQTLVPMGSLITVSNYVASRYGIHN